MENLIDLILFKSIRFQFQSIGWLYFIFWLLDEPYLAVDEAVVDCQEGEGNEVEKDQVHPVDIDLNNTNL